MSVGLLALLGGLLVAYLALLVWMMSPDATTTSAGGEGSEIEGSDGEGCGALVSPASAGAKPFGSP